MARAGDSAGARAAAERVKLYNEEQAPFGDLATDDPAEVIDSSMPFLPSLASPLKLKVGSET